MNNPSGSQTVLVIIAIIILGGLGYYVFNGADNRTTAEHVGDAISNLPNGADRAAKELENKTPAEKIGDKIKDEVNK